MISFWQELKAVCKIMGALLGIAGLCVLCWILGITKLIYELIKASLIRHN